MIRGVVNAKREAVVRLRVRGPGGVVAVDATIDTGFTAALALPPATVAASGLVPHSVGWAVLADGSACRYDYCLAEVEWDGVWRPILVSAVGVDPLVGMSLLANHEMWIAVKPGGGVAITPIP